MMETKQYFEQFLRYRPAEGIFIRMRFKNKFTEAGCNANGYRILKVNYKIYKVHRLVWFFETGEWPNVDVHHVDGDKTNNRFSNLKLAPRGAHTSLEKLPKWFILPSIAKNTTRGAI